MGRSFEAGAEPIRGYRLVRRLGSGAFGEVWQATSPGGFPIAIKRIFGQIDEQACRRELRALQLLRQIRHPYLLAIQAAWVASGQLVFATALADKSLRDQLAECRAQGLPGIPLQELQRFLEEAAEALDFLNQTHQIQHRDIKPDNLLLVAGHVQIGDFGLSRALSGRSLRHSAAGTPLYVAPEIWHGRPHPRSDQYSLALTYYELRTGRHAFDGKSPAELMRQHLDASPRLDKVPDAERRVLARALAKDPNQRWASCREFARSVQAARSAVVTAAVADEGAAPIAADPWADTAALGDASATTFAARRSTAIPRTTVPVPGVLGPHGLRGVPARVRRYAAWAMGAALLSLLAVFLMKGIRGLPAGPDRRRLAGSAPGEANVRLVAAALHSYQTDFDQFPAGARAIQGGAQLPAEHRLSWLAALLPYLSEGPAYRAIDFRRGWDDPANAPGVRRRIGAFLNPSSGLPELVGGYGATHLVGAAGVGPRAAELPRSNPKAGVFGYDASVRPRDISDGLAHTIMILGVSREPGAWAAGGKATVRGLTATPYVNGPDGLGGTPGGLLVGFADGSVRVLSEQTDPHVIEALMTTHGDEATDLPF